MLRSLLVLFFIVQLIGLPAPSPADECCSADDQGRCSSDCSDPCANCACCADRSPTMPAPMAFAPRAASTSRMPVQAVAIPGSPAPREILHVPEAHAAVVVPVV